MRQERKRGRGVKLKKLLEKMDYELIQGSLETEVSDIAYDSREIGRAHV